nr:snRNA-activating protein complex subunit 4-like [Rhipicephalus microplus]
MPTDLRNLLALNRAYQALLDNAICELAERLEENRQLRMELLAELSERSARPAKPKVRKNCYHSLVFHHPYFRDINGMRAPMNEDEKIKRANKEMDPYLTPPLHWSAEENRMLVGAGGLCVLVRAKFPRALTSLHDVFVFHSEKLLAPHAAMHCLGRFEIVEAVKSNVLQRSLESMMDRKEALAQKILETEDPDQIAEITARIDQLEEQMAKTRDLSLEELLEQATRPIDWLRIAAVDMRTNRTPFDCEARWRNLLDVRLNQGPWTPEEDERLATVAAKWKERNWDQIGLDFAAASCLHLATYTTWRLPRLATRGCAAALTVPCLQKVKKKRGVLIFACRRNTEVSWDVKPTSVSASQIAQELKTNRSTYQCAQRYMSHLARCHNTGSFTDEENHKLKRLISVCSDGDNISWSQVSHYMNCRSKKQLINRYHRSLHPNIKRGRWSAQEDVMLLVAVKPYGDVSWSKS